MHKGKIQICCYGLLLWLLFACVCSVQAQQARQMMSRMTLEEKIAQLMIVRVSSTGTPEETAKMLADIERYQPGGVCFFKGGPVREAALTNRMQQLSKVPLFVSIDGEWGPAMRLDSCTAFPRQMTLGALASANDSLIYQMGLEVARQCRALGVNLNFAPCIDINNNPKNPVINSRSFGESREKVVAKGYLYLKGMQDGGITGCIKHFPGHGDTETDSHLGLPTIHKSRAQLDEMELYPYRQLLPRNPEMVMVAHLHIPALDDSHKSVSSLSQPIVTGLLKQVLGYSGLVITDGLEMKGVRNSNRFEGDIEIRALLAGADLLLLPGETGAVIQAIKNAVDSGLVPMSLINERCLRVLSFKEMKGFWHQPPADLLQLYARLNTPIGVALNEAIEAKALTLLKDEDFLPIPPSMALNNEVAVLCVGRDEYKSEYRKLADKYNLPFFWLPKKYNPKDYPQVIANLQPFKSVIVLFGGSNQLAGSNYGVDSKVAEHLRVLARGKPAVLVHLGNPYVLDQLGTTAPFKAVMVAYQFTPSTVKAALSACFGEIRCEGLLPVSTKEYVSGTGLGATEELQNFSALPQSITERLDALLAGGIRDQIYPGCVVVALKDGNPVYQKAFGNLTYDTTRPVTLQTMYDVASLTKPAATTLAVMKLYDEQRIRLTDPIGKYLTYLTGTNKANIPISELLTHTSGLPAYIPFYKDIQGNPAYFQKTESPEYSVKVADDIYLLSTYPDTVRYRVAHCKLGAKKYVYSDLNFLLLKDMVETITGKSIEVLLDEQFYKPMGLTHTCFNPLEKGFDQEAIAPTENDVEFRRQVVRGYVHDQTAALMNGNAGNAGLFTTGPELGALFQMLLDGGIYHGKRYFSEETVRLFTAAYPMHDCNVRGLGYHTPKHGGTSSIVPQTADKETFGHQGFTGIVVWCDPSEKLTFVFLSNRVYPDCYPNKLSQSGIRLKAHELIYEGVKMMKNKDLHER